MPRPWGAVCRLAPIKGVTPRKALSGPLYIPALLNELDLEEEFDHTDFTTHRAGEFSIPSQGGSTARRLRPFTPDFLTLDWEADWLTEYRDPEEIRDIIRAIGRSKLPVEMLLVFYRGRGKANVRTDTERFNVTLRRVQRSTRPGEADTRYWTVEMKEWRQLTGGRLADKANWPKKHVLKANTNLYGLAKRYYGTTDFWRTIAKKNYLQGGGVFWGPSEPIVNSHSFKVGDVVVIPAPPKKQSPIVSSGDGLDVPVAEG